MRQSIVTKNKKYTVTAERWIVSMMATGDKFGGHAKIVVEGIDNDRGWLENKENKSGESLYVAEYHIIPDANPATANSRIPTILRNAQSRFGVYFTERSEYKPEKIEQYSHSTSSSYRVSKERALRMIDAIKQEKSRYESGEVQSNHYQYAGCYRRISGNSGHNCVTWCQEKLAIADISTTKSPFNCIKAKPRKETAIAKLASNTEEDFDFDDNAHREATTRINRCSFWCKQHRNELIIGTAAAVAIAAAVTLSN